ncbi:MAG: hypothetical protein WDN25_17350 [Acetobacteraceae bacterium]
MLLGQAIPRRHRTREIRLVADIVAGDLERLSYQASVMSSVGSITLMSTVLLAMSTRPVSRVCSTTVVLPCASVGVAVIVSAALPVCSDSARPAAGEPKRSATCASKVNWNSSRPRLSTRDAVGMIGSRSCLRFCRTASVQVV